jgi:DNA-binding response OmpR family regulator
MDASVGQAVLLLEDEALIAMDVEELLHKAGFSNILTHSSCADAKEWLQDNKPAFAVIETRLRDGPCDEIARFLAQHGVQFVVHSTERDNAGNYKGMSARCSWVEKPCDPDEFLMVVRKCKAG